MKAVVINKDDNGYRAEYKDLPESDIPSFKTDDKPDTEEVLVDVAHSTLNYKDALAITGKGPVVRTFPLVAGIDFAGTVSESNSGKFKVGDKVVLNGWSVGEKYWGGLAEKARVKPQWLVKLPDEFSTEQAMAIGTAGYTAMLCVMALEKQGVTPEDGEILVTGATGGVGSVAISILSKLGYDVVAMTGKMSDEPFLKELGATSIIDRAEYSGPGRPLAKERWAGAIDVVGSHTLANVCASTKYGGAVAACGLAGGMDLPASVAPFILRGVILAGVDSVMCPQPTREAAWQRLSQDLDVGKLAKLTTNIGLSEAIEYANKFMDGTVKGRFLVDVSK